MRTDGCRKGGRKTKKWEDRHIIPGKYVIRLSGDNGIWGFVYNIESINILIKILTAKKY